ncbi:MAG: hypothetical protein A2Y55_12570 [Actinobacteria bacterium RBG_16_68_12]|nr:MAG: hypothetical protein A2Y55_12570 [Actinobacteria bacterium RBG_16_68_12]
MAPTDRTAAAPVRLRADPAATARRLAALRAYMEANVLGPGGFRCTSEEACRGSVRGDNGSYEGQLSHVGRHYDLHLDGRELRVMVVGQEDGSTRTLVSLDQRYEKIYNDAAMARRYLSDGEHVRRSFHMRGTTSALRLILGKGLGTDWEGEFVHDAAGSSFHIFDAFALVNALLCAVHPPGSAEGRGTKLMRRNCLRHFDATVKILEPTLVLLQGEGVQEWIAPALGVMHERSANLAEATIDGRRVVVCRFSHPSARGKLSWGNQLDAPYLLQVVEPTLRLALSLL